MGCYYSISAAAPVTDSPALREIVEDGEETFGEEVVSTNQVGDKLYVVLEHHDSTSYSGASALDDFANSLAEHATEPFKVSGRCDDEDFGWWAGEANDVRTARSRELRAEVMTMLPEITVEDRLALAAVLGSVRLAEDRLAA